ncbi:eukaryotic translation initiation factor 4B-like isoform X2 [Homalodisca vitripennis]|uniref:eukaryotic translation initiation factor 4B-like isoform X2 n=1 Tax=Homalodisca vitripennis TaxID=197043 RepID=UPI001EEC8823|nr:eukaryotic translation initiation factor 4B-like isoform X2 [Homalodisca vitripennis]
MFVRCSFFLVVSSSLSFFIMASTGGKSKKTKWKPFPSDQIINPNAPRKLATSSWADESNDVDDSYDFGRKTFLPTAPRAARGAENDANIPKEPPYQAYLTNISYEVTEEDLTEFFSALRVKKVILPRDDKGTFRAKGFGYVEFEDRASLIEALSMIDTTCKNRRMRIEVADNVDQGRGGRVGQRERGPNEPDRTMGDWRSGPRSEAEPNSDGYRSGPRRDYGNDRDNGMYGGGDRERRGGGFRDDERDRGGFRNSGYNRGGFRDDRGGGFRDERGGGFREDRGGGGFRDDRGGYRDGGGDRYERRGYEDRRDDRRYDDRKSDYGSGSSSSGGSTWRRDEKDRDVGPPPERNSEPKTRTPLNLQPRSRPVEGGEKGVGGETPTTSPPNGPVANSASIFGGARPVDTSAREREIEERLAKQREDRPPPREESRLTAPQRDAPPTHEEAPASPPPLEPAPPPKENAWARRSQQNVHSQVNNGRISPHEEGERHKPRDSSPSKDPRKYQPPRRNIQDDKRRDERNVPRGGGAPRGGGPRNVDMRQAQHPKSSNLILLNPEPLSYACICSKHDKGK